VSRYRKPTMEYFNRRDAPELYEREEAAQEAVELVAREISRLLNFDRGQFFTHAVPEALAGLLDAFDQEVSILAATAYLESRGYEIQKKGGD
jgi:hypothetical protein